MATLPSRSQAKATAALETLDTVRCNGEWQDVPALVKKVERRAPGRSCLCLTALTEHAIQLKTASGNFASPEVRKYLSDLLPPLAKELAKYHLPLPKLPSPTGGAQHASVTPEDVFQAKVTVAWIHFLIGEYQAVLEKLPTDEETPKLTGAEGVGYEYTRVALVKAIVLRGLALEFTAPGDLVRPLHIYKATTKIPPPPIGLYTEWRIWTEKALGRFALVAHKCWTEDEERAKNLQNRRLSRIPGYPRDEDEEDEIVGANEQNAGPTIDDYTVLFAFRSYHKLLNSISAYPSTPTKDMERGQVYRQYLRFVSALLDTDFSSRFEPSRLSSSRVTSRSYASSLAGAARQSTIGVVGGGVVGGIGITRDELMDEIRSIQAIYENYFMGSIRFPKADAVHAEVLEWVDLVMANWVKMGSTGSDAVIIVDILYRACSKTFHSPRILRHLFTTLTATGKFKDAALALNTYIDLIGRAKERIAKGAVEKDFDDDSTIITTAVEGIRVLCKYLNNGKRALEIATLLEKWLTEWGVVSTSEVSGTELLVSHESGPEGQRISRVVPGVLAAAWRGVGIANSYWARQTVEANKRPEIQEAAEDAFRRGLDYDDEDVDGIYGLGMVLAETRNIEEAVDVIKNGLMVLNRLKEEGLEEASSAEEEEVVEREYRRVAVPLWHLLALLLSASEEFDGALRVCDAVFEELGGEENLRKASSSGATDAVETSDPTRYMIMKMGPDEKENILEVKMTHMALVELVEGPDAALSMADELLKLYTSLFYASNLQGQIEKVQLVKQQQLQEQLRLLEVEEERPSRMRPMSRYSKAGRQHKKQASTATVMGPGSAAALTQGRPTTSSSTITGRPKSSHAAGGAPQIQVTGTEGSVGRGKTEEPESPTDGKLHKRSSRSNSVSGGTIRRRKSVGSAVASASASSLPPAPAAPVPVPALPPIRTSSVKVKRSPSLGGSSPTSVPPVPTVSTPATPTRAAHHTHIFHLHKHVKAPSTSTTTINGTPPRSGTTSTTANDLPGVALTTDGETQSPQPLSTSRPRRTTTASPSSKRYLPLSHRLPEPTLPEDSERTKFLTCLRRVWLLIAALYRRGGFHDESLQAIDEAAKIRTTSENAEADVLVERGYLAIAMGKRDEALGHFENALGWDWDNPRAVVGLCQIVFEIEGEFKEGAGRRGRGGGGGAINANTNTLNAPAATGGSTSVTTLSTSTATSTPTTNSLTLLAASSSTNTATTNTDDEPPSLSSLIARNRAHGLLSQLTKSGRGWDCSEAWFELARSFELSGLEDKARGVYWWCVGLEDSKPVRGWGGVTGGGAGSGAGGRGWGGRV